MRKVLRFYAGRRVAGEYRAAYYMETRTMNAEALTVARWCWPDAPNEFAPNHYGRIPHFYGVADAELILIERGHLTAYGNALATNLGAARRMDWNTWGKMFDLLALAATAPLPVRVAAMAAVIRSLAP